jgi:hypothetical protein
MRSVGKESEDQLWGISWTSACHFAEIEFAMAYREPWNGTSVVLDTTNNSMGITT